MNPCSWGGKLCSLSTVTVTARQTQSLTLLVSVLCHGLKWPLEPWMDPVWLYWEENYLTGKRLKPSTPYMWSAFWPEQFSIHEIWPRTIRLRFTCLRGSLASSTGHWDFASLPKPYSVQLYLCSLLFFSCLISSEAAQMDKILNCGYNLT